MKKVESNKGKGGPRIEPAQPGAPLPPPFDPDYEIVGYLENPGKPFLPKARVDESETLNH